MLISHRKGYRVTRKMRQENRLIMAHGGVLLVANETLALPEDVSLEFDSFCPNKHTCFGQNVNKIHETLIFISSVC